MSKKHRPGADQAKKWQKAIDMRLEGSTYGMIAVACGYADHTGARYAVNAALEWTIQEPADSLRQIEGVRLDHMSKAVALTREDVTPVMKAGKLDAEEEANRIASVLPKIQVLLRIQERRARLFGLDAPTIQKITTYVSDVPEDIVSERILRDPEYREHYLKCLELAQIGPPQPSGDGNGGGGRELGDGAAPSPPDKEAGGNSGGQLQAPDGDDATGAREVDPG